MLAKAEYLRFKPAAKMLDAYEVKRLLPSADGRLPCKIYFLHKETTKYHTCWCGGMADATDSKSVGGNIMWVRLPPPAPQAQWLGD